MATQELLHAPGDVARARVGRVDEHPAALEALRGHQVEQRLLLRVELFRREGRDLHQQLLGLRVEDRLAARAAVGIGEERLQVGGEQPAGALREGVRERRPQRPEELVVARALREPVSAGLRVH